jgi:hypothetical protein
VRRKQKRARGRAQRTHVQIGQIDQVNERPAIFAIANHARRALLARRLSK